MAKKGAPVAKKGKSVAPAAAPHRKPASTATKGPGRSKASEHPRGAEATDAKEQARAFDQAVRAFNSGNFGKAEALFEIAAQGPLLEMAHAATTRVLMCRQRLAAAGEPKVQTAEEHYELAIGLINRRDLKEAQKHLEAALKTPSDEDHIYYALALCRGLSGDVAGACEYLRKAIERHPRNRAMARRDPDFAELAHYPAFRQLIYG